MNTSDHSQSTPPASAGRSPARAQGVLGAAEALENVIAPIAETMGFELVHLEWNGSGKHRRLCVYLDKEGGIALSDCARMSPILSNALDAAETDLALERVLRGAYTLEVSSPGLDRPLSKRGHFERYLGKRVRVATLTPLREDDKQKNFHGTIAGVEPDPSDPENERIGTLNLQGEDGASTLISLALIRRANLVFEG